MKDKTFSEVHMKFDPKAEDPCGIVGKKYGHLTVLKYTGYRMRRQMEYFYLVQCDCPNKTIKELAYSDLESGNQCRCGKCGTRNLVKPGDKYGSLTVLEVKPTHKTRHFRVAVCSCSCDPNVRVEVNVNKLKSGHTKSCGAPIHRKECERKRRQTYNGNVEPGDRFGDLEVLEVLEDQRTEYGARLARCLCHRKDPLTGEECGKITDIVLASLTAGRQRSCGCALKVFKNPHCLPLRHKLHSMIDRCYNKKSSGYPGYGGRGIKVCALWRKNELEFIRWSLANGYPDKGDSIERIDVNGDYCPENCCYIPRRDQPGNTRFTRFIEVDGVKRSAADWARQIGVQSHFFLGKLRHFKGTDAEFVKFMLKKYQSRVDIATVQVTIDGKTKGLAEWGYEFGVPPGFCIYLWKRHRGNIPAIIDEFRYWKQTIELPINKGFS